MRLKICNLIGLVALYTQVVHAEGVVQYPLSEHDYLDDVPRVLTVSRLSQSVSDSPSAVTIIDRETIRASGVVDLPDLFRLVPGMYVGANAGYIYNTNHAVSYHGMTTAYSGNMQVLINGRSVYTPLFGGVKWSELPVALMDIERIEVTRGPNAASYGANAFFATINIITKNPSELSGNTVLMTHGDGRNEAFYRHAGKAGDWAYRATVGYRQDDGFDHRNDFKRTRFVNVQTDYQINLNNNLELELGVVDGERGEGNINEDPTVFLPRTKDINNFHGLMRWKHQLSDTSDFQLQAYHSYDRSNDETTSVDLRPVLVGFGIPAIVVNNLVNNSLHINNDVVTERTDIEAQHTFTAGDSIRAVWGGSVRHDTMYAPFYLGTSKTDRFDLQRLFGHVEWRPHRMWTANVGAMLEHNDFTGTDISPRASINFKPLPEHTIRVGMSSAQRTPSYLEEKFNNRYYLPTKLALPFPQALLLQITADDGKLKPEQIISREIGYVGKIGSLNLDARIFSDRISDVIRFDTRTDFTVPSGDFLLNKNGHVDTGLNSGDAAVEGAELQADWKLSEDTRLLFNYAHVSIRETHPKLKKNFPKSMPSNSFSAMLTHRFDQNWDVTFAYYQVGETTQLGDGDPADLIRKSDLRIARKFKQGNVGGEVSLAVENLFNSHYLEFADYNEAKRRARINLKLDF